MSRRADAAVGRGAPLEALEDRRMMAAADVFHDPVARITLPVTDTLYHAGAKVRFAGAGFDRQDGRLDARSMRWSLIRQVGDETEVVASVRGQRGAFVIPADGPADADQKYRVRLRVTDSDGRTDTVAVELRPRLSTLTAGTNVPGLRVNVDGRRVRDGAAVEGVVGTSRVVNAPQFQESDGVLYRFAGWSDGGARIHEAGVPFVDQALTAFYVRVPAAGPEFPPGTGGTGTATATRMGFPFSTRRIEGPFGE